MLHELQAEQIRNQLSLQQYQFHRYQQSLNQLILLGYQTLLLAFSPDVNIHQYHRWLMSSLVSSIVTQLSESVIDPSDFIKWCFLFTASHLQLRLASTHSQETSTERPSLSDSTPMEAPAQQSRTETHAAYTNSAFFSLPETPMSNTPNLTQETRTATQAASAPSVGFCPRPDLTRPSSPSMDSSPLEPLFPEVSLLNHPS